MTTDHIAPALLKSFWMAGFEGASHINSSGKRLDMVHSTHHDLLVDSDYAMMREVGIQVVRESVRWHLIERGGRFDFSSLAPMLRAATEHGVQVNWTLCHYGWPDDLDLFSPAFVHRFARFSAEVARFIADHSNAEPVYSPINEISFICWAVCHSDLMYPYAVHSKGRDNELKRQLVRAAIEAIEAVWEVDPRARIIHIDPIIHIIAPPGRPDLEDAARAQRASMFEAWDMLRGSRDEDLGGDPKYLDIIGVNYYHSNQWEYLTNDRLHWHLGDPRRMPLHRLLQEVYERYQVPMIIGETSHVGAGRGQWIREIAEEVCRARQLGVPVEGVCLYPIVDRTDWENDHHWHNSGLWDVEPDEEGVLRRVINQAYLDDFLEAQRHLNRQECKLQHPEAQAGLR
ncbi:glycoside hydrolase family 1 protein [Methylocaldum gracile]|jgi:beta-glucosidase/6-phospho-beta-glucosidase/beta-galactosidase|uniref:hypothetical protein n=1 Tax=unclassified Methylocaldum TaxID=2622260 RepID=UPI00105EBF52